EGSAGRSRHNEEEPVVSMLAVAAVAFMVGVFVARGRSKGRTVVWQEPRQPPSSSVGAPIEDAEVDDLLRNNQLIAAIKRYRELSGLGLKESKDAMEARRRMLN